MITGFGEKEVFPGIIEIEIEGIIFNVLKKRNLIQDAIRLGNRACIYPFAQDDVILQFMYGISEQRLTDTSASFVSHLDKYTTDILEHLEEYADEDKEGLLLNISRLQDDVVESFNGQQDKLKAGFAKNIIDTVEFLPKQQLAEMAEALVSLTTLKRRVSQEEESVGGPTDLALVTKGDGFVWLKRKNYFPAELNPAYFARKYGARG